MILSDERGTGICTLYGYIMCVTDCCMYFFMSMFVHNQYARNCTINLTPKRLPIPPPSHMIALPVGRGILYWYTSTTSSLFMADDFPVAFYRHIQSGYFSFISLLYSLCL